MRPGRAYSATRLSQGTPPARNPTPPACDIMTQPTSPETTQPRHAHAASHGLPAPDCTIVAGATTPIGKIMSAAKSVMRGIWGVLASTPTRFTVGSSSPEARELFAPTLESAAPKHNAPVVTEMPLTEATCRTPDHTILDVLVVSAEVVVTIADMAMPSANKLRLPPPIPRQLSLQELRPPDIPSMPPKDDASAPPPPLPPAPTKAPPTLVPVHVPGVRGVTYMPEHPHDVVLRLGMSPTRMEVPAPQPVITTRPTAPSMPTEVAPHPKALPRFTNTLVQKTTASSTHAVITVPAIEGVHAVCTGTRQEGIFTVYEAFPPRSVNGHVECPICHVNIKEYRGSNPRQAFYNHLRDVHHSVNEYACESFYAGDRKYACRNCGDVMQGTGKKTTAHRLKCSAECTETTGKGVEALKRNIPDTGDGPENTPLPTAPTDLPTLREVSECKTDTMKKLPRGVMGHWTRSFTRLLTAALHQNTTAAWTLVAMFAKCVAPLPVRGGKHHGGPTNAVRVSENMKAWDRGEYGALWKACQSKRGKNRASDDSRLAEEKRAARAEQLTQDAQYSRAMASLTSEDLAPTCDDTRDRLQSKHPASIRHAPLFVVPTSPAIAEGVVRDAIRSFGKGCSGGTFGLRAEYLQDALSEVTPVGVLATLTRFVNHMKDAKAPPGIQPFFAGARLTALLKKNKDVRPIAAGEVLRRLVAKCLCATHKETAAKMFAGLQYGVATPAGCERMIHEVRRQMRCHATDKDWVLLKIDLTNAFNCISRARMLELVHVHLPHMYSWVEWCYRDTSHLTYAHYRIASQEGVQQGDPLGPLLFSVVIQELILRIRDELPDLTLNKWYLDDGVIAGRSADVLKVLELLTAHGPKVGVFLNLGKCELVTHPASAARLDVFPLTIPTDKRRTDGCTSLLGAPIGSDAFCEDFIRGDTLEPARRTLTKLGNVTDPQISKTLLRHCTGFCQFVYALRATPPTQVAVAAADFDDVVMAALQCGFFSLPENKRSQVRRGIRSGGLGIRSVVTHSESAYIASVSYAAVADGWRADSADGYNEAVASFNKRVAPEHHLSINAVGLAVLTSTLAPAAGATEEATDAKPLKQKTLSAYIDAAARAAEYACATRRDRKRLTSQAGEHAALFLGVVPDPARFQDFTPREYTMLVRWWLGMPVYAHALTKPCPACGTHMDNTGYHALVCKKWGGKVHRHHSLCNAYVKFARGAHLAPLREQGVGGRTRPADVFLPIWDGRPLALDFAVTHPQQPKYLNGKLAEDVTPGGVAAAYAAAHKGGHFAPCRRAGVNFRPMVVEAFGSWDPQALSVLRETALLYATHQGVDPKQALQWLGARLNVVLMRQNVRMLLARASPDDIFDDEADGDTGALSECDSDDTDEDDCVESIQRDDDEDSVVTVDATDSSEEGGDCGDTGSEADAGAL